MARSKLTALNHTIKGYPYLLSTNSKSNSTAAIIFLIVLLSISVLFCFERICLKFCVPKLKDILSKQNKMVIDSNLIKKIIAAVEWDFGILIGICVFLVSTYLELINCNISSVRRMNLPKENTMLEIKKKWSLNIILLNVLPYELWL